MENAEMMEIMGEIYQYVKKTGNYSYYDLLTLAYNEKNEWIPVLTDKKMRVGISTYLKSAKYSSHTRYKTSAADAMERCMKAKIAYEDRQQLIQAQNNEQSAEV